MSERARVRFVVPTAAALSFLLAGCAGGPGVRQEIAVAGRTYHARYVKPAEPPSGKPLIALFTGDAGWLGTSGMLLEHLAAAGYPVAGFDSREALKPVKQSGEPVSVSRAADALEEVFDRARSDLGGSPTTPLIVVGFSRGASAAAFAAVNPKLHAGLAGVVAIALTREVDYLKAPPPAERPPGIQVDEKGRMQLYPALDLIGSIPLAVIQSTGDHYVPAAESRRLLGPDTPTRRLYEVTAKNHGFSGGEETLLRDLDEALLWISPRPAPR